MGSWKGWVKLLLANQSQVLVTVPTVTARLQLVVKATQPRPLVRQVTQRAESRQVSENWPAQANWARLKPAPVA
jgi:hypothetical protein